MAAIQIELTADRQGGVPGTTVTVYYEVTNVGEVDLANVTVTDSEVGLIGEANGLTAQTSIVFKRARRMTNKAVTLIATVRADEPSTHAVTDSDTLGLSVVLSGRMVRELPRPKRATC